MAPTFVRLRLGFRSVKIKNSEGYMSEGGTIESIFYISARLTFNTKIYVAQSDICVGTSDLFGLFLSINFLVLRECLPHHILFEKFLTNSNSSFNGT